MSGPGRPRVLDDVKRGQIIALVAAGSGLAAAAPYVGCSVDTVRREALRNDDFRRELHSAEVRGQIEPLQAMRRAAGTHWRAAAWLLERANPEQFDRRGAECKPRQLLELVEAMVTFAVDDIGDDELRDRVCRRLMLAARRSSRVLTAAERARIDPKCGPFDAPAPTPETEIDELLAEVEARHKSALDGFRRGERNSKKCA